MRRFLPRLTLAGLLLLASTAALADELAPQPMLDLPEVDDADILRLSPKMAKYLIKNVHYTKDPRARVMDLVDLIRSPKGLNITYEKTGTKTAIETFESRSGNCLSFTILFVAMARHLGLNAYFQEVAEVMSWDRRGDIVLRNQHMFAEVELMNGHIQVDFLPGTEKRYRIVRRITEYRAQAHYYNNLAVDLLARDELPLSLAYFEKANRVDSTFAPAWTNRGVALRRLGDRVEAEKSHQRAIREERSLRVAQANLASLYQNLGRHEEAQALLGQVEEHLAESPFYRYQQGTRSLRAGNSREAIRHLRAALRKLPREVVFHERLAEAYAAAGDAEKAAVSLGEAIRWAEGTEAERLREVLASISPSG